MQLSDADRWKHCKAPEMRHTLASVQRTRPCGGSDALSFVSLVYACPLGVSVFDFSLGRFEFHGENSKSIRRKISLESAPAFFIHHPELEE